MVGTEAGTGNEGGAGVGSWIPAGFRAGKDVPSAGARICPKEVRLLKLKVTQRSDLKGLLH